MYLLIFCFSFKSIVILPTIMSQSLVSGKKVVFHFSFISMTFFATWKWKRRTVPISIQRNRRVKKWRSNKAIYFIFIFDLGIAQIYNPESSLSQRERPGTEIDICLGFEFWQWCINIKNIVVAGFPLSKSKKTVSLQGRRIAINTSPNTP